MTISPYQFGPLQREPCDDHHDPGRNRQRLQNHHRNHHGVGAGALVETVLCGQEVTRWRLTVSGDVRRIVLK
jgi:hypothetical protein